jgi:hypothetical protein
MASIEDRWFTKSTGQPTDRHGKGKRWRARYSDDNRREHGKSFARKIDAE